ncbi:hypothetical protein [Leisingera caerulea]|uniref:hypothetical protein n=1 Tax=Leisingera caerulea TaxID=506591 RepID=UPI0021A4C409|nr:hypothetical protein [Leisingera caerulea]UWQ82554.1 hypothetical protein K3726_12735 [Leisingera caerulea]
MTKQYKPKSCARCSEEFTPTSPSAKYCSTCRDEVRLETGRVYYLQNREKLRETQRKWRKQNPEYMREASDRWRKAKPEKQRDASRRWYEANSEKRRAASREWYLANREKVLQMSKKWQKDNHEKALAYQRKHRETKVEPRVAEIVTTFAHERCFGRKVKLARAWLERAATDYVTAQACYYRNVDDLLSTYSGI